MLIDCVWYWCCIYFFDLLISIFSDVQRTDLVAKPEDFVVHTRYEAGSCGMILANELAIALFNKMWVMKLFVRIDYNLILKEG